MNAPNTEAKQELLAKIEELIASAVSFQNARQFEKAEGIYQKIVAIAPGWAEAQSNLASALQEQGKLWESVGHYEKALALKPGFAEIHYNLGNVLKDLDQLTEAAVRYEKALALKPDYPEAHNNLGIVRQQQKKLDEAVAHYEQALALHPNYAEAHNNIGALFLEQRKVKRAAVHLGEALRLKPDYAEGHNNLGIALQQQRKLEKAIQHYERALVLNPDYAKTYNNLGAARKEEGKLGEATALYGKAIALKPDFAEAHYNRAELIKFHRGDKNLAALESLAAGMDGLSESKRIHIHFGLAKALDDIGDYPRAFEHMLAGNALKRQELDYDEFRAQEIFQLIRQVFDAELFSRLQGTGDPSRVPIFVLGMPRSGSTLIEQILASHPDVYAAGELDNLNLVANSGPSSYPACISKLDADGLRRLGRDYLASLPELPAGNSRLTDKSPLNFQHIGLIHLILPHARIIHTVRDPVGNCVSCFSKLFTFGMQFTYNLGELGRYFRRYSEMMAHWRSVLPPDAVLDVSYEAVVDNLKGQARRLLDYCGLPWDDRCLSFYKTSRPVTTASAVQVRQPLFRSSLHRGHHYNKYLQPLLDELVVR